VVSVLGGDDDLGAPLDSGFHLGIMARRQADAPFAALRLPVGAAAYANSSSRPGFACACAVNGSPPSPPVTALTEHRLNSETGHIGSSVQGLQSKPLAPSRAAPRAAPNTAITASADPDCLYEILHCANAPAAAEPPTISAADGSMFRSRQSADSLLRGVAASLAVAQGAHGAVAHVAVRTAGAIQGSNDAPHAAQPPLSAALGSAVWSLARTQRAEAAGALQSTGWDGPAPSCDRAVAVASHGSHGDRWEGPGLDVRSSQHAGMCGLNSWSRSKFVIWQMPERCIVKANGNCNEGSEHDE
jgi:hypothetical protein